MDTPLKNLAMPTLPTNVTSYKRTPNFTQATVPRGLLKDHSTKAGTWGVLTVLSGALYYHITLTQSSQSYALAVDVAGIIVPEQKHYIELTGEAEYYLEFYR
jgi:tellurite resistance-related uncharacterized protein